MTFEYQLIRESEHNGAIVGSIELCIDFKVTDWGCPARIRYNENDHPAEQPEIEVTAVWMEHVGGTNVWVRASEYYEDWARDWAGNHLDLMIAEAHQ